MSSFLPSLLLIFKRYSQVSGMPVEANQGKPGLPDLIVCVTPLDRIGHADMQSGPVFITLVSVSIVRSEPLKKKSNKRK